MFRFSLQAVLRFRQNLERRERLRLEAATRDLAKARRQYEEAELDRANAAAQLQSKLRQGMTAEEVRFELACDRARRRCIAACLEQVGKMQALRQQQLEAYQKARQRREILENLRQRQLAAYSLIQTRREQQQMDDRFLAAHSRLMAEP